MQYDDGHGRTNSVQETDSGVSSGYFDQKISSFR